MAGKSKPLSRMLRDVHRGDRVRFSTLEGMSYTGHCLNEPSSDDPRGKHYNFSKEIIGEPVFFVCPTNKKHTIKPADSKYESATSYIIMQRAPAIVGMIEAVIGYYTGACVRQDSPVI